MKLFSCIIAFHNEDETIISVIDVIAKIKCVSQIICVDDGSTNDIYQRVKEKYPEITMLRLDKNRGKAAAVTRGLDFATNDNVLLMDADLRNVEQNQVEFALKKFDENPAIDMIILENKGGNTWIDPFINKNIFLSGQRILQSNDLRTVLTTKRPVGYQLEVAINAYMMENSKKVHYMKTSSFNPHKIQKNGFLKGIIRDIAMDLQIISYLGISKYFRQLLTFGRSELR